MREISFVKRLKFNFNGSITKKALVIGDADNDQNNELVCANLQGDLAIFKETNSDSYAHASNLGMVTACVVGDVINSGKNYVAAINTEGLLFIFDVPCQQQAEQLELRRRTDLTATTALDPNLAAQSATKAPEHLEDSRAGLKLTALYDQRMPSNCKELLLADLDGDGQNEVIVGLTDRVLRTYKWIKIGPDRGKFVGLYKWEFADQIGAVSLNPSQHENCQDIIVAQPGGTYAKLECFDKKPTATMLVSNSALTSSSITTSDDQSQIQQQYQANCAPVSDQGQLIAQIPTPVSVAAPTALAASVLAGATTTSAPISPTTSDGDNVRTEYISKLTPEYHQLALAQMRNHHISTEVLGGIRDGKNSCSRSLIVIATLDGTLMLVNKDDILWSLQVAHQLFALAVIETPTKSIDRLQPTLSQSESACTIVPNQELPLISRSRLSSGSSSGSSQTNQAQSATINEAPTPTQISPLIHSKASSLNGAYSQHFVACAWNGKTYIIDEERNYLRFKFDEAVSAFTAGNYHFDGKAHASLVYATFNNQIILYHDVILDHIRPMYLLNEVLTSSDYTDLLIRLETVAKRLGLSDELVSSADPAEEQPVNESSTADHVAAGASPTPDNACRTKRIHELLQDFLYNVTDEELHSYPDST